MSYFEQIKNLIYNGTAWVNMRADASTSSIATIDYAHHEIHGGSHYVTSYNQLVSDIADKSIVAFKTAAGLKNPHILAIFGASSPAKFYILEAPTITDNTGAPLAIFNNDRNSINTSGVIDTSQNPDVAGQATYFDESAMANVTAGTKILEAWAAADRKRGGGDARGDSEFILLPNTLYAFVVESITNDDNYQSIVLEWYEHTANA